MNEEQSINQTEEIAKTKQLISELINTGSAVQVESPHIFKGRKKIYTNYINQSQVNKNLHGYQIINEENIVKAINLALPKHYENAREIHQLLSYYKGEQSIVGRTKDVRPDINNQVVINYANTFTRNIVGYTFSKPMQYVVRKNEGEDEEIKKDIRMLNDFSELNDKSSSDQEKAVNASIYGISHRGIFTKNGYSEDESPYYYINLDSECTFVAYSSQLNREPVFAVTYTRSYGDSEDDYVLFTVYTTDEIYVYKVPFASGTNDNSNVGVTITKDNLIKGYPQKNPLGLIPIIECENNQFRMGHWETATTLMDAINKIASDSVNDVEQFVNAILVAVNAEFSEEQMENVKKNKYAEIRSPQGLPADLKYIQCQLDGSSTEQLRQYLEDCLRAVVGIPDRKTRSGGGGDTGDAVKLRDGWGDMEEVAKLTETFNKKSEKQELKVIFKILKVLKKIKKASMINVDVKYPRNKTDNLNSKVTALSTMLGTRVLAPEDALDIVDITSDNAEVIERGEKYWKKKKEEEIEDQRKQLELKGVNDDTQKGGEENARTNTESRTEQSNSGSNKPNNE